MTGKLLPDLSFEELCLELNAARQLNHRLLQQTGLQGQLLLDLRQKLAARALPRPEERAPRSDSEQLSWLRQDAARLRREIDSISFSDD